jgi:hypothetical protein
MARKAPLSDKASRTTMAVGRVVIRALPARLRKLLDDRLFYAIFQLTRATNDHYPQPQTMEEDSQTEPPEEDP